MDLTNVPRDLSAFADAGTDVSVEELASGVRLRWFSRGARLEAMLAAEGTIETGMRDYASYKQFLASAEMADLAGVARAISNTIEHKGNYLDPDGDADLPSGDSVRDSALSLIERLVEEESDGRTRLIFVTADAGSGKTTALRELVRLQAERYLAGLSGYLYLYVNAQGRALARFNEAMAVELQDLRTRLTYHAIAPLVREGLVVPVVDGFDELIGTQGGYDDAFSSLSTFLAQLHGRGSLIAAARSVYYEQEFLERANAAGSSGIESWTQWPVRLRSWSADQVRTYASRELDGDPDLVGKVDEAFSPDSISDLRGRPLFVARVVDLVKQGVGIERDRAFLDSLVDSYLRREQNAKLLSRTGRPLLDAAQLREYYTELALEMWRQETRQLSRASLREIAELFASVSGLDDDGQRILVERAPTLAFMATAGHAGSIEFEHETFLLYFLASRMASTWEAEEPTTFAQLLSKSDVTDELATYVSEKLGPVDRAALVARLQRIVSSAILRREQIAENCGALAVALLRDYPRTERLMLEGFEFAGLSWAQVNVQGLQFVNCTLRRCDLRAAQLRECEARSTVFDEIAVGPATRLEVTGLEWDRDILGIRWSGPDEATRGIFDPAEARAKLAEIGLPSAIEAGEDDVEWLVDPEIVDILRALARAYARANPVCEADRAVEAFLAGPKWKTLLRALLDSGVVTDEARATRGSRKRFFRCHVLPKELMAGQLVSAPVDPRVRDLWSTLAQRSTG